MRKKYDVQENLTALSFSKNDKAEWFDCFQDLFNHDAVSPLARAQGLLQVMKLDTSDSPADYTEIINSNINYSQKVANAFSSLEEPTSFDLSEVALNAYKHFELNNSLTSHNYAIRFSNFLTESVVGNSSAAFVGIHNFLTNINRYAQDTPYVDIEVNNVEQFGVVSVRDYVSSSAMHKGKDFVFAKNKTGGKGKGHGMYLTKKFAELYDGTVDLTWTDEKKKSGSTFTFVLPLQKK